MPLQQCLVLTADQSVKVSFLHYCLGYITMRGIQIQGNYEVILLSHGKAGKNHFINEYLNSAEGYSHQYTTAGVDDMYKIIEVLGKDYMLRMVNVNGKSEFEAVAKEEVRGKDIFVLFYDVNQQELAKTTELVQLIERSGRRERMSVLLMGTKTDLLQNQSQSLAHKVKELFGNRPNFYLAEVSAKEEEEVIEGSLKIQEFLKKAILKVIQNEQSDSPTERVYSHWSDELKARIGGIYRSDLETSSWSSAISKCLEGIQLNSPQMILIKRLLFEYQSTRELYNALLIDNKFQSDRREDLQGQLASLKQKQTQQEEQFSKATARVKELEQTVDQYQNDGSDSNLRLIEYLREEVTTLEYQAVETDILLASLSLSPQDRQKLSSFHSFATSIDEPLDSKEEQKGDSLISAQTASLEKAIRRKKREGPRQRLQKYKELLADFLPDLVVHS